MRSINFQKNKKTFFLLFIVLGISFVSIYKIKGYNDTLKEVNYGILSISVNNILTIPRIISDDEGNRKNSFDFSFVKMCMQDLGASLKSMDAYYILDNHQHIAYNDLYTLFMITRNILRSYDGEMADTDPSRKSLEEDLYALGSHYNFLNDTLERWDENFFKSGFFHTEQPKEILQNLNTEYRTFLTNLPKEEKQKYSYLYDKYYN